MRFGAGLRLEAGRTSCQRWRNTIASGSVAKRLRIFVATLALLLSPSIVQADEVTGRIALVDDQHRTVTLTSGMTFLVAEDVPIMALEPGEDITITFAKENGVFIAVKLSRSDGDA